MKSGGHVISFLYLGAKHMVTGYDHILFVLGVVFFLYRMKDVAIYVSIFAVGHSVTMRTGVWWGWAKGASRWHGDHALPFRGCLTPSRLISISAYASDLGDAPPKSKKNRFERTHTWLPS
ncbi:hypothetical protein Ga0609869_001990 [Rhodovulum iodosum]|uniref:HupE/UreJ family protein n=1 Tax=Rhodovulum iodosum TaxID=68291 RepID=A0ABV3XW89_9RHOB